MNIKKIEEIENLIKQAKQGIDKLNQNIKEAERQIEELKREELKFEYPNVGDVFWYMTTSGVIDHDEWKDDDVDKRMFHRGNIFFTKEETEFELERAKVIKELELFKEPEYRPWKKDVNDKHYYIDYDLDDKRVLCGYNCWCYKHNDIYFATEEDCQKAIDFVGKERVKKYYLRIKE